LAVTVGDGMGGKGTDRASDHGCRLSRGLKLWLPATRRTAFGTMIYGVAGQPRTGKLPLGVARRTGERGSRETGLGGRAVVWKKRRDAVKVNTPLAGGDRQSNFSGTAVAGSRWLLLLLLIAGRWAVGSREVNRQQGCRRKTTGRDWSRNRDCGVNRLGF
jgi:hypothetical protein